MPQVCQTDKETLLGDVVSWNAGGLVVKTIGTLVFVPISHIPKEENENITEEMLRERYPKVCWRYCCAAHGQPTNVATP